jgi:hypothetical protein
LEDTALARRYIYASFAIAANSVRRSHSDSADSNDGENANSINSPQVEAALDTLAAAFVALHYARIAQIQQDRRAQASSGRSTAAPVHFLHISKSGGTTVCAAFQKACGLQQTPSMKTPGIMPHCWLRGTGPQWEAPRKHQALSCKQTEELYSSSNISMLSNEGFLAGDSSIPLEKLCNTNLLHFTLLRNPFSRTMSHSKLNNVHTIPGVLKQGQRYDHLSLVERMTAAPEIFHNYMIRVLTGKAAYELPSGQLTSQHLTLAQRQIARFDTVGILEDTAGLQDLLESMMLFPAGLNFKEIEKRHRGKSKLAKMVNTTSVGEWAMVLAANQLDFQAWRFGGLVFKLDHLIFERGRDLTGRRAEELRVC